MSIGSSFAENNNNNNNNNNPNPNCNCCCYLGQNNETNAKLKNHTQIILGFCVHSFEQVVNVMLSKQKRFLPLPNYISIKHPNTNFSPANREEVVDYTLACCDDMKYKSETAFVAINLFDRYLSLVPAIPMNKLQTIIAACILLASKFHEVKAAHPRDLIAFACYSFTDEELVETELKVLIKLSWEVNPVTTLSFVQVLLKLPVFSTYGENFSRAAESFAEFSLVDYSLLAYPPSLLAAACLLCAHDTCRYATEQSLRLMMNLGFIINLHDVQECREALMDYYRRCENHASTNLSNTPKTTCAVMNVIGNDDI